MKHPMFIYFIQCGDRFGPIKIGTATDVHGRLVGLQTGCPTELRLLGDVDAEPNAPSERDLHGRFNTQRIRGEWFAWSPELQAFIDKQIKDSEVKRRKAKFDAVRKVNEAGEARRLAAIASGQP